VRILSVGAAAPDLRLPVSQITAGWGRPGGRGRVALCGADEDALTLAAEAGTRAIAAAGLDAAAIDGLWWGTSTPPFADGPSHAVLAATLGLGGHSGGALLSGSAHSGMEALLAAADAVAGGAALVAVVVVSDSLLAGLGTTFEHRAGAGAAAVVLGTEGGAASLGARVTRSAPLLDRYRGAGDTATRDLYDARLFREEIFLPLLLEVSHHLAPFDVTHWSLPDPDGRLGAVLTKTLDAPAAVSASVYGALGDTGAAAALLGAVPAFDAAGTVALVAYGGGRSTGVCITVDGPIPGAAGFAATIANGRDVTYTDALRSRGQLVPAGEQIPMGVPPESAMFVRGAEEMLELLGARCVECGVVNTPPSIHPACIGCGADKFEQVSLARRGTVHTFVINQTMPAPFVAPLPIAVIDLEDGARVMLQVIGRGDGLAIGSDVELVLRRYAYERAVPVYGFKARPLSTDIGSAEE